MELPKLHGAGAFEVTKLHHFGRNHVRLARRGYQKASVIHFRNKDGEEIGLRNVGMGPDAMMDTRYRLAGLVQKSGPVYAGKVKRVVDGVINGAAKSQLDQLVSQRLKSFQDFGRNLRLLDLK